MNELLELKQERDLILKEIEKLEEQIIAKLAKQAAAAWKE